MIDLELYRIFVIVAKEQNITSASKILHISQPAVTKHIQNLEDLLNTRLFERTNKGLILTDIGRCLYEELREPINTINKIDDKYSKSTTINVGSHNHLLNKIFGNCINKYYLNYEEVNLNLKNFETDVMLDMLKKHELDIVFSKKVNDFKSNNIKYIKLGYLHDIFIASNKSKFKDKILRRDDLRKEIIYVPRTYAQTVERLKTLIECNDLKLKNSSYNTILELVSKTDTIGFITKEYVDNEKIKKCNLIEIETEFQLQPVEFGIYLNDNSFKELREFVKIIEGDFLQ